MSNYREAVEDIKKALTALEYSLEIENRSVTLKPNHPDARWHLRVSVAKSLVRIVAGGVLCMGELFLAGSFLVLAEVLGIVEELV
jgi:hypothetical protein